jgi:DNA polymerase-3 subunit alpha
MQIAQVMAGYSLGDADLLRRAMGKKIRAEMDKQREIFVAGATKNSVPKGQAQTIFELLAKFADYGFNKSHAAAYALVSFQTAYMKAHYPVEFIAASMTLDMNNTDKLSEFRAEAQRLGIKVDRRRSIARERLSRSATTRSITRLPRSRVSVSRRSR